MYNFDDFEFRVKNTPFYERKRHLYAFPFAFRKKKGGPEYGQKL